MWFEHAERGWVRTTGKHSFDALLTAYADSWNDGLLLLSMVGAATSVDAIRANASMGRALSMLTPNPKWKQVWNEPQWDERMLSTKDQKFKLFKQRLSTISQDHYILVNRKLFEPNINAEWVYAWGELETPREEVIGAMLRRVTPLAIFPTFYGYLIERATEAKHSHNISHISSDDGTQVWGIKMGDHWEKYLSEGLKSGVITMPEDAHV
jgi:hypothetical protein